MKNKLKRCKGILKRIKVSANGKIKRQRCGRRHIMSGKPSKLRRKMRKPAEVEGRIQRNIRKALGLELT